METIDAWQYYTDFLSWSSEKQTSELREKPAAFWQEMGQIKALQVFHAAAERVPAYKKFLHEHGIDHHSIKTLEDFKTVPVINKKNYLKKYPLHELCWDGDLTRMNVVSVSSGSTGQPFFWPRDINQEHEVDHYYDLCLRSIFEADHKHSLVVIAFAIGMYVAGPFTFASALRLAQKGNPISIVTPGNDIATVLRIVENLGGEFEQIIIGGYPPLVKDIVEEGVRQGIDWKAKNTRLFFGGEGFSEKWRDHVHGVLQSNAELTTSINMYGTADAALVGIETPTSIAYRRIAASSPGFLQAHFQSERLPSMVSYNPLFKFFEVIEEEKLIFTTSSGVPLIRYEIGDVGGLVSYDELHRHTEAIDTPLNKKLSEGKSTHLDWNLPVVYLFGRHDFTVHLYGANVYPENIKEALEDSKLASQVTGKFIITTEHREDMSPYLFIRVQLAPGVEQSADLRDQVQHTITEYLKKKNSEYLVIYNTIFEKAIPEIQLDLHGNEDYAIRIKHRWVKH